MMNWQRLLTALCLLCSTAALAQDDAYRHIPLKRFNDQAPVTLAGLPQGKPLYLKFWASWCQPCMEQMPHFEQTYQRYQDKLNVLALNININESRAAIDQVVERYGLHIPIWLDNEGALGVALGLVGTPYHVLINGQGQVVYSSHEADAELDRQLALLAAGKAQLPLASTGLAHSQASQQLAPWLQGEKLLFFTATWCDWYLADTRPAMAQRCTQAQQGLNGLTRALANRPWQVVVNHLWTDQAAVQEFRNKFQLRQPIQVDHMGLLFHHFAIRDIPTLLWVKGGQVLARITDFDDQAALVKQLSDAKPAFLPVDQAFALSSQQSGDHLVLTWDIADGYYLYQDQLQLSSGGRPLAIHYPQALTHQDPYFGTSRIYRRQLRLKVPLAQGQQLKVRFRGCADAGLCYPPASRTLP